MANPFSRLTSIHGRRIAMSATGAIVDKNGYGAVVADSSGVLQSPIKTYVEAVSSSGAAMSASGLTYIAAGTATSQNFTLAAPSSGLGKEIFSLSSASTILVETTATGIFVVTTGASSTAFTFSGANNYGQTITLRGLSSTRWASLHKTSQIT